MTSVSDILSCLSRVRKSGPGWVARCPAHDDHNPSLSIQQAESGKILLYCHAGCNAQQVAAALGLSIHALFPDNGQGAPHHTIRTKTSRLKPPVYIPAEVKPVRGDLGDLLCRYQAALPGSLGEEYLKRRGISLDLAQSCGLGYSPRGEWAHRNRDWRFGRVVFAHTDPEGQIISLYGRAVGDERVPHAMRHDHLPGNKGYFNAVALRNSDQADQPLFVCEGPFDALSLIAAGHYRAVAIFGVHGWRWDWARGVDRLALALDADNSGQQAWRDLAFEAILRGKAVASLPASAYGGHKDANEAWIAGILEVGDWLEEEDSGSDAALNEPEFEHSTLQRSILHDPLDTADDIKTPVVDTQGIEEAYNCESSLPPASSQRAQVAPPTSPRVCVPCGGSLTAQRQTPVGWVCEECGYTKTP